MLTISYKHFGGVRSMVLDQVGAAKAANSNYRVVDIGGQAIGWSAPIVDMVIDINAANTDKTLGFDICKQDDWQAILDIVARDGLYDYAICTHTLEDVYDPFIALDMLPKIAQAGVISMPGVSTELSRHESQDYLGFIHHRWVFDQVDGKMLVVPKVTLLESLVKNRVVHNPSKDEICYEWSGSIEYCHFMNNFLGPSPAAVLGEYDKFITDRT